MSELLDAEAWLDEQLAAATPPQQDIAVLPDQPGTSPLLSPSAPEDPTKTSLYDMAPAEAPAGGNAILYPRFTDLTLPQTPRGPVPEDPVEANRQANAAAFGDDRMDAAAWLDNAVATTPTPRSVKLPSGISSYGNDYLKTIDTSKLTPEEFLSINPDVEVVRGMLHNPQYKPTFEEWQDLSAIEKNLISEGKIQKPGNLEMVANAAGGLIVLASDFIYNTVIDADGSVTRPGETIDRMKEGTWRVAPAETLARSPATMLSAGKLAGATMQYIGQMIEADWNERPQYVVNETGEMLASSSELRLPNKEELSKHYAAQGQTIRPVNEQELQKFDYERFAKRRDTQKLEDDALNNTTAPTEIVTMLLTGRNQIEKPIQSQAQVGAIGLDPTAAIPFASASTRWGLSAFGKKASAKMLGGLEKVSGGLVRANDAMFDRFAKTVSDQTGVELTAWQKGIQEAKTIAKGSPVPIALGAGSSMLGVDPGTSAAIATSFGLYRLGRGVLRTVETGSRLGKTILRESADATNGLDQAARLAVAANPAVPAVVRDALERPTNFIPIESTPARVASNPAFGPTTRAVADRLSNPFVVQAVRNTAALAKGSAKGAITNAPFAYLEANAGNEEGAAGAIGAGLAFGAAGAAFERVGGLRDRRVRQAVGDIGRMLVDVELAGGDVNHLVKTRDMQGLADLAAIQGYYRNGFEFVPLNNTDYNSNKRASGQKDIVSPNKKGTAGYFLQVPDGGGKPIIYMNLDATNRNPLPHEIGHLITAGGLENPQKVSARAWVEKTYGPDGIKVRGEEYARTLIQARADAAARAEKKQPQPVNITPDMLAAEMESLGQDGLVRGDLDTMDWARDEIFAETFATNSASMDWASIRRGNPVGGNFLTFAEGILGAQARGLMAAGVRIDPQTGAPLDTTASLFKQNPVLAADPEVMKQLETYSKNFNAYLLNPDQTKPRGARIAPSGKAQELVNTGLVKSHANDKGGAENLWTITDANGVTRQKSQGELNAEQKLRAEQTTNLFQTKKLSSPADPTVSRKKRTNGNIEIFGRRLPQNFFFSNSFGRHIRDFARLFEEAMDNGETLNTSYFAVLTKSSDTGAVRDKDLGNAIRIDREVMPFEWFVSGQNNILASVLDITKFRNRVNRAIRDGDEPLARLFDNKWENIDPAFKKLLDNHRNNLPGETGLGAETRDVLNALIGIGTNENKARNPYNGRYGKDSAIERFRLDRINDSVKSGRTSFHFDYSKAAGNALPEVATPLPDLSKDLPTAKGQAMPDAVPDPNAPAQQGYKVPEIYKVIPGPNGKSRVINAEGKKVTDYPNFEKAMARATKENNLLAPMSDLKKLFNREDRQAITDAQKRITEVAKNNPEATRLEIQLDETGLPKIDLLEDSDGNPILDEKGNQVRGVVFAKKEYELRKAPGLSKDDNTAVKQGVALLLPEAKRVLGIPAIAAGKGWYVRMRDFLQRSFGANIEVFGQLLGATSARTPVDTNFKQGLEALRLVALGKYDDLLQSFDAHVMDIKAKAESGQLKQEWLQKNPNKRESLFVLNDEYRKAINTFKDVPLRDNGAKYNANSQKVLHALYGIWLSQTKGPKTPNFAGNLTGRTLRATIDVWAARNLRRLLYSNKIKKWRILPEQESGVKYTVDKAGNYGGDFEYGQRIYDEVARQLNMNPDDLQAVMWFAEKDVWETNGWTNTVGAEKSSFDKEAGKLNLDRYQIGLTTFTSAEKFDPKVQEAERISFRNAVRKVPNLAVSRITESSGLYGGVLEPTFDVEFSVQRDAKIESQNYLEPTIREALAIADRRGQIDVLTSLVVDVDHPNARPMVEVGFKSPAKPAEIDAVVEAFKANGIDGFTIAKNERGDVLGLRSQYVPEISARYDTPDHLDPAKFVQNSVAWNNSSRAALAQIQNIDNVSYRKEGYVSSAIYGKEEYRTVNPVDLRRSNAANELGRRRSILKPGS